MWRWSVEHSATPASLQQPATTCAQTVKYSAKRNAHGSTPSYVDRDSLAPLHLYTGSGVYKDAGSGGYATLWTFGQFKTQFGRDWNNDVVVAAINGDWDANGRQVTSVRVSPSGNRIDVMFDGKNTAPIRVNWAVMWRG